MNPVTRIGTENKMKLFPLFLFSILAVCGLPSNTFAEPKPVSSQSKTASYSQKDLLKNWAHSICIAQISRDTYNREDAGKTAAAYLEYGKQPLEAYDELRSLVKKYVQFEYAGATGSNFDTMKCIDLYNSKELDSIVRKWTKK